MTPQAKEKLGSPKQEKTRQTQPPTQPAALLLPGFNQEFMLDCYQFATFEQGMRMVLPGLLDVF